MKRTFALTIGLALASLGVSAYAQTPPADQGQQQTQSTRNHKKHRAHKKDKKTKTNTAAKS